MRKLNFRFNNFISKVAKTALLGGVVSAGVITVTSSYANTFMVGFLDERTPAGKRSDAGVVEVAERKAPSAPAISGGLTGDLSHKDWDSAAPFSGAAGSALPLAIIRLLPPSRPGVQIDASTDLIDAIVDWPPGMSRKAALREIAARNSLNINVSNSVISVRRAQPVKSSASTMITEMKDVIAAAPRMAAAPVVQPDEQAKPRDPRRGNLIYDAKPSAPSPAAVATAPAPVAAQSASGVRPAPGAPVVRPFEVRLSDIKLSTAMYRWAAESGVRIKWDADRHVLIGAPMVFKGNDVFDVVVQALSTPGIRNSDYPLEVCEYQNTPKLLRITRQGEQSKDCPGMQ
jgi:Toxin co-regulated pilus biosynthesis protein Q